MLKIVECILYGIVYGIVYHLSQTSSSVYVEVRRIIDFSRRVRVNDDDYNYQKSGRVPKTDHLNEPGRQ